MKRILLLLCSVSMLLLVTAPALFSQTQEQPLGDVARLARRQKPAPTPGERVYDNDNLPGKGVVNTVGASADDAAKPADQNRSEEHTSELQSHLNLVCRLLLEKKNKKPNLQKYPLPHPHHHSHTRSTA